ncbi:MAG: sigma-70 family RNA polymerase sigma factor [Bacteroidaceae bacterium]|nr:sigma-70 family RNA polymerase sigma factor [Bacteroidaceae bacterium]
MKNQKEADELIEGLRKQQRQAQQRMLLMYGKMVFCQVARIVTCQEDAEEVFQDVFVKAFDNIKTYDSRLASLSTWLKCIAYNESLNFMRKSTPPIIYVDDRDVDLEIIQDETLAQVFQQHDEATVQRLEKAIEFLSPHEQALINMFYYDDMNMKDIAYVTSTNISTIGSQLTRTRKKLYKISNPCRNER